MNNVDLTLELPNFSGPLDLLLHLIRSQKIDIYDIPIAKITAQYLNYIAHWQKLNLQIAGEYFVMASTLLRIKSQYLLPKNDFDEQVEEFEEDPRNELVEQLVQYSVFQKISTYFKERNEEVPFTIAKEPSVEPKKALDPLPLGEIQAEELAHTFAIILKRFKLRQPDAAKVEVHETSIEDMVQFLEAEVNQKIKLSFFEIIEGFTTLDAVISLFLAVLELARYQKIRVSQNREFGDLLIERKDKNDH
ncbi:segregation and condensation protein A [Lactobacillus sp. PV034]|uniref:segregation and condensation protein A n=1 Tax=Lactobacillus sp. PV034 TaxID=2594495 RepID=UPI002240819C|nr:segregation/condensation protein A [Lactobacillus sp. PV034]QNQ80489.1 segregation and condensation protein A [Lactobacillus sp. PV034]